MAISSKPNITLLWADEGSYEAPTDEKILQGWVAEIPPYESQNWWQHRVDEALKHIFQAGIAVWDANTLYSANRSVVQSSDGVLWRALIDNTGQNPLTTSGVWTKLIQDTKYVPVGMVAEFASPVAPAGYLVCDGSPKSRTAYAELFATIGVTWGVGDGSTTFNLPDFRGVFRRGWDNGRGLDPARTFASSQTSQNLAHNHSGTTNNGGVHGHTGSTSGSGNHTHTGSTSAAGNHTHTVPAMNGPTLPVSPGFPNFVSQPSGVNVSSVAGNHTHSLAIDIAGGHVHDVSINAGGDHNHIFSTTSVGASESRPVNVTTLVCIKF
jgi:microcystin-dependent protein